MAAQTRVRGAPVPLTAGPPGVRQFRPTAFEQATIQRAREFNDEKPMINPYNVRLPFGQQSSGTSWGAQSVASAPTVDGTDGGDTDANYTDTNYIKDNDQTHIFDTLSSDEAAQFYPDGLPMNFDPHTQRVSSNWQVERLSKLEDLEHVLNLPSVQVQQDFLANRRRKMDNLFYRGNDMINKPFDMALSEHNHRSVAHIIGRSHKEPENSQGKLANRLISIPKASAMPASEHAAPLLSMAFQALSNHPEVSPYTKLPKFEHSLHPAYLMK
jgi:hypothetical protein